MAETAINVPIKTRTHELNQLHEFLQRSISELQSIGRDKAADEVSRIYSSYVEDVEAEYPEGDSFANYISMPTDDWQIVVRHLSRIRIEEGLRVQYLQNKLVKRLSDRLEEMEE